MTEDLIYELYELLSYSVRRLGRNTTGNLRAQREIVKIAEIMAGPLVEALGLELRNPGVTHGTLEEIKTVLDRIERGRGR